MALTLDQKYSAIIDQLGVLNTKFNRFINGDETVVVPTDSGGIRSIAGTTAELLRFRYVQKVIDHRLYSDMVADSPNIEVGMLIRVYGDTDAINGLYKKTDTGFLRVTYSDLYDLGNKLPNPWNYQYIKVNPTDTVDSKQLLVYTEPLSSTDIFSQILRGNLTYTTTGAGVRGVSSRSFKLLISTGDTNLKTFNYQTSKDITNDIDGGLAAFATTPQLDVAFSTDAFNHTVSIWFKPPTDAQGNPVQGTAEITFEGIDRQKIKLVADVNTSTPTQLDNNTTPVDENLAEFYSSI